MEKLKVVDLFSGCGGMSYGFHKHPAFEIAAAADAQIGKPSSGKGALQCNSTYVQNIGVTPAAVDLSEVDPGSLREILNLGKNEKTDVLIACPPCTGFSRVNPKNHIADDSRNSLVTKVADFTSALQPSVLVMENAREMLSGNFKNHFSRLRADLETMGYNLSATVHRLETFGLPQIRERALVVAVKKELGEAWSIEDLWEGRQIDPEKKTVRYALSYERDSMDEAEVCPSFFKPEVRKRIEHIPKDGGSWIDLTKSKEGQKFLTPAMLRIINAGRLGSHPDVYGRMAWDKPAPTIKRECGHIGNGRYAHPEEHRLLTVREMGILQGFPRDFIFAGSSISNLYRHIGDAVPPLISFQIAHLVNWILTKKKPTHSDLILENTHLSPKRKLALLK